ncbi:hypothetical protein D1115_17900 [Vibrio alfacsensis]|uniref:Uncharacterized protein n=1 Tax=Vibrio alfacsensis TaxID=1074311 RepID=A0ABM6YYL7_9VIBR|nr:hypothetical protein D1115_17900 [Vibrio alfacsensis]
MHLFPQSVLNHVSQQLPFLVFPIYYHSSILGGLFMAHRLLKMPAGVVTMALRNVFFLTLEIKIRAYYFTLMLN